MRFKLSYRQPNPLSDQTFPYLRRAHAISAKLGVMFLMTAVAYPVAEAANVTVDGGTRYQMMDGFGSSERVFDDPHLFNNFNAATGRAATVMTVAQQDQILDKLYIDLHLTRVRPASPDTAVGAGIEPVNDNGDPNVTDLSKFNFSWKNLDAHMDYMARARQRGVTTSFLSPLSRESWMGTTTANDVAEYSEWLLAQVKRSADLGVRMPYLSVSNEPSYSRNTMSGAFLRDVIKDLGPRLRAEGFDTKFVTPDDVRASDAAAKTQFILADPAAREYVGALATHLYDESVSNVAQMKTLSDQYQLPLWMTEFTVGAMGTAGLSQDAFSWASLMHDLISTYNVSAVDYLWGSFGEWEGNATTLISLNNTGATYDGYTLNKPYYTMGQFSRFVEPGAIRVKAQSSDSEVQTTAYVSNSQVVVVAINKGHVDKSITFGLNALPGVQRIDLVRTSATENWANLPSVPVSGSNFTTSLPPNSITTFFASLPGDYNRNGSVDAADYTVWRHSFGQSGAGLAADGDGSGAVDQGDYNLWRQNFGSQWGSSGSASSIPEPPAGLCILVLLGYLIVRRGRPSRISLNRLSCTMRAHKC